MAASVTASVQVNPDFDGPEDRQLADDIARVMHHRPLMSRLARVESAHEGAAGFVAKSATLAARAEPAAVPAPPPLPPDARSLEEVIDDLGYAASPPPSAEWLDNARLAHRQERMRHAMGWLTTLAIASSIVAGVFLLLRV